MEIAQFRSSVAAEAPPDGLSGPLLALWYDAKGDWDHAHQILQDEPGEDGSWVHAYLHRVEGDESNAGHWYRKAGRPRSRAPLADEWEAIAGALLAAS